ncbi:hypothetical protein SBA3_1730016 [Candidatus Sulfopaludibacter sp. SbA3]|nr:hypothetical protein SBA3_1730016 [Candidatus Sulfopaludibacter sp. SbA3]
MVSAISNVTQTQPTARSSAPTKAPSQAKQHTAAHSDSVQLSQTAQAALAAMKEATETPAQTTTEAGHGDPQAMRLLAKETHSKR